MTPTQQHKCTAPAPAGAAAAKGAGGAVEVREVRLDNFTYEDVGLGSPRDRAMKRIPQRCSKCWRRESDQAGTIQKHHIVPQVAGGGNEAENLIGLCTACHTEWHSFENMFGMEFSEWVGLPPGHMFAVGFRVGYTMQDIEREVRDRYLDALSWYECRDEFLGCAPLHYELVFTSRVIVRMEKAGVEVKRLHSMDEAEFREVLLSVDLGEKAIVAARKKFADLKKQKEAMAR